MNSLMGFTFQQVSWKCVMPLQKKRLIWAPNLMTNDMDCEEKLPSSSLGVDPGLLPSSLDNNLLQNVSVSSTRVAFRSRSAARSTCRSNLWSTTITSSESMTKIGVGKFPWLVFKSSLRKLGHRFLTFHRHLGHPGADIHVSARLWIEAEE